MQNINGTVVVLGTGGTIAGTAASAQDHTGYSAAQIGVAQLLQALPMLAGQALEAEQVAQLDSKDMDHATWARLARRVAAHLARPEVTGIVVTHGTDTLEETAYFLQRVLAPAKPVVLVAAMRPATALQADGPQNLLDALVVARTAGAQGVVAVLAGAVHRSLDLRKTHSYRLDAFGSGDAGVLGWVEDGRLRQLRAWPACEATGLERLAAEAADWPAVAVLHSHVGVDPVLVRALCEAGVRGLVVAGTGNGTLQKGLRDALLQAQGQGVRVLRCTRCAEGAVLGGPDDPLPGAGALTPWQARIELMLALMPRP